MAPFHAEPPGSLSLDSSLPTVALQSSPSSAFTYTPYEEEPLSLSVAILGGTAPVKLHPTGPPQRGLCRCRGRWVPLLLETASRILQLLPNPVHVTNTQYQPQ